MGSDADKLVIAYEPVWAIGTGLTRPLPTSPKIHAAIRAPHAAGTRNPLRGSVNPKKRGRNPGARRCRRALRRGANLEGRRFLGIAQACSSSGPPCRHAREAGIQGKRWIAALDSGSALRCGRE